MWDTPTIVLITGIMASGRSTMADELARRLPRSAHLRGDLFRRMVVNGRAELTAELSEEAWRQRDQRWSPPPSRRAPSRGTATADFDAGFRADTPRIGLWLDTSEQTPAQTVDEILARAWTEGRFG